MSIINQQDFIKELVSEFDLNKDSFRCYTLESNPKIKVILFGKQKWETCHIGFLINNHFHVLGLGSFAFINEDAKALLIALSCTFPQDEQKLKVKEYSIFNDEEQIEIKYKLNQIFSKQ